MKLNDQGLDVDKRQDAGLFQARKLDEKYGLVGEVVQVDPAVVNDALAVGYIPVVSTVAQGVAVSYTHLDVYKRQPLDNAALMYSAIQR